MVDELQLPGSYDAFAGVQSGIEKGKAALLDRNEIAADQLLGAGIAMPTRFRQGASFLDLAEEVISWAEPDM